MALSDRSGEDVGVATEELNVRIDAELKRCLEEEAKRERRSASRLAVEEADRGMFISRAAMDRWVSSWDGDQAEPPEPDIGPAPG